MKMGDRFALPVNGDDVLCFAHKEDCDAAAHAINCHDELVAAIADMDAAMCNGFDTQEARTAARLALIRARAAMAKAEGRS